MGWGSQWGATTAAAATVVTATAAAATFIAVTATTAAGGPTSAATATYTAKLTNTFNLAFFFNSPAREHNLLT